MNPSSAITFPTEEFVSSPSPTSGTHSLVPPVPDPRAPFGMYADDSSMTPRAQHSRSHSETAHLTRNHGSLGGGVQASLGTHQNNIYQGHRHVPSGLGIEHHHHHHASGHHARSPLVGRYHSAASDHGHHHSTTATSPLTPPPLPYDIHFSEYGITGQAETSYHHLSASHQRHSISRHRTPSGGHDNHLRCSPDCTAAEAPYHLLATVIGRASVQNLRDNGCYRHREQRERIIVNRPARPNIQTRRSSKRRGSLLAGPVSPSSQVPSMTFEFKPLSFDRRQLESTPPLPPVNHTRQPPAESGFFSDHYRPQPSASQVISHRAIEHDHGYAIPRSSSAPALPLLASQERRLSDASFTSALSSDGVQDTVRPGGDHIHNSLRNPLHRESSEPITSSPRGLERSRSKSPVATTINRESGLRRHATVNSRRLDPLADRSHSIEQLVDSSSGVEMYLGPELAAAFKRRLQAEQVGSSKVLKRKEETITEEEWSFDVPFFAAMQKVLKTRLRFLPEQEQYQIVEYGCQKEMPSVVIAEAIKSLSLRSAGINKPKKVFGITHQCDTSFDIRQLQQNLASMPSSYRKVKALPTPTILTSFSFADFVEAAGPPNSVDLGICAGELSKLHGVVETRPLHEFKTHAEERSQMAEKDMTAWLKARSKEIKPGGLLVYSFTVRTGQSGEHEHAAQHQIGQVDWISPRAPSYLISMSLPTSPTMSEDMHTADRAMTPMTEIGAPSIAFSGTVVSPPISNGKPKDHRPDLWQAMSQALTPAIQRLVSLGEIRSHVAPMLVDAPHWPRSLTEVKATLGKSTEWEILVDQHPDEETRKTIGNTFSNKDAITTASHHDHSDNLEYQMGEMEEWAAAGVQIHKLYHPAWKALQEGQIDRAAYARRVAAYANSVYEAHLKKVLREKGKMDISQSESTVQELYKILVEKCELGALDALKIDIGIVVLRRR
nr:uncharacterized protein CI109_005441 [Kwoniella shandongensis]KAA5526163.1 hypothetical protein CI109_005441 [Kwoniella shandongensis]